MGGLASTSERWPVARRRWAEANRPGLAGFVGLALTAPIEDEQVERRIRRQIAPVTGQHADRGSPAKALVAIAANPWFAFDADEVGARVRSAGKPRQAYTAGAGFADHPGTDSASENARQLTI